MSTITLESLQTEIESLHKKMDLIIELLKPKQIQQEENTWSVTDYKNSILISFTFNTQFKEYVKELGGMWMVGKKAWMFPKASEQKIIEQIILKFPEWKKI